MYLRNLIDCNNHELDPNRSFKAAGIILFALILIIALLGSSLTERESDAILNGITKQSVSQRQSNGNKQFGMQVFFVKLKVLSKI